MIDYLNLYKTFNINKFRKTTIIRLLEYAKEDAKTDMDLHKVAENAVKLSSESKTLKMVDYNKLIS